MRINLLKTIGTLSIALALCSCAPQPYTPSSTLADTSTATPQKIALLLPLHGPYAQSGQAIRNGFLAAYYAMQQSNKTNISVQVVDTSKSDITTLYNNAVQQGCNFIVGPLTKKNVQTLADMSSLPITTLALNSLDNDDYATNLYQFGLSPTDEAIQVAKRAWQEHSGRALIIVPNGSWGDNLLHVLQQTWSSLGGTVAATLSYNPKQNLTNQVRHLLNVDASQARALRLKRILGMKFKYTPRRRQDFDVILLIAFPNQARQLRPLLSFYFAENIPIYATSTIFSGFPNPQADQDLNDIIFCDTPLTLQTDANLPPVVPYIRSKIVQLWPSAYRHSIRLYGLGMDAYYLMLNLNKLSLQPNPGIAGATGTFYIDAQHHIHRQLTWAKIVNGTPVLIPNS